MRERLFEVYRRELKPIPGIAEIARQADDPLLRGVIEPARPDPPVRWR